MSALLVAWWARFRFTESTLVLPASWVLAEWLMPVMFPWPAAILAQGCPTWLQLAEVGGPLLVSWWIVASGTSVGVALASWSGTKRTSLHAAFAITIVVGVTGIGTVLARSTERRITLSPLAPLGVVQGAKPREVLEHQMDTLQYYRQETLNLLDRSGSVDMVVWPETILAAPIQEANLTRHLRSYVRTDRREGIASRTLGVPILLGLDVLRGRKPNRSSSNSTPGTYLTNSLVLFDEQGAVAGTYDKQILVPVGESPVELPLPSLGSWEIIPAVTRYQAGTDRNPMRLGRHSISTVICYEDMFSAYVRDLVNAG